MPSKKKTKIKYFREDWPKEKFKTLVMGYFTEVENSKPKTFCSIPGLANYLKWDIDVLMDIPDTHKFYGVIKRAKQIIEEKILNGMQSGSIDKTTGVFMLKNHFGYKEKVDSPPVGESKPKTISEVLDQME